jgi:cobalt-zinc-cadmium efflux system outer membrane protein
MRAWTVHPGLVRRLYGCTVSIVVWASAASLSAQSFPANLSLNDARRIALEQNWDLLAARGDVDAAVAQRIIAREFPNPQLAVASTKINLNGTSNATAQGNGYWQRSYDTVIAVNQLLEIAGKRSFRRAIADAGIKAAEARFRDAQRILEHGVAQAYIAVLVAQEKARILSASADSLRREAEVAGRRLASGDIMRSEMNQIEIAADRMELDARSAEQDVRTTKMAVEILLGCARPAGEWQPSDVLRDFVKGTLEEPAATGETRPDLEAARAEVEKAEAGWQLQRALRVPDPTLLVQYEHEPGSAAETIGLGVSLPLPLWNRNHGAIRAAGVARAQAEQQQRRLEAQISAEIALARRAWSVAAEKVSRQRDSIEPKSAAIRKSVAIAYEKGGASLLELLAAERSDNEVRLATAQAAGEAAVAHSALWAALNLTNR